MKIKTLWLSLLILPFSALVAYDPGFISLQVQGSEGTIRMGETAELAKFRLTNQTGKNVQINSLRLRNYGSARLKESFENLSVENNGCTLGSVAYLDHKEVVFHFNDTQIGPGDSLSLSIKGRLIYAKPGRTVKLGIQYEEDVNVSIVGLDYFSLECRGCRGVRGKTQKLRGGGIYLNSPAPYASHRYYGSRRAPNDISRYYYRSRLGSQTYAPGAKDITFFSTYLQAHTDVSLQGLFLAVANGSDVGDKNGNGKVNEPEDFSMAFSDFKLWNNGYYEDYTNDFTTYGGQTGLLFDSPMDIKPNAQLVLTGRATLQATTGDKVKFSLNKSGLMEPEYYQYGQGLQFGNIQGGSSSNFSGVEAEPLNISK